MRVWKPLLWAVIGLGVGLGIGLAIGWGLWPMGPMERPNSRPAMLRWDYRNDYVLMVAATYEVDGDLERARERLALLDPAVPIAPVVALGEQLVREGGDPGDIGRLARLAWAFGAATPLLVPYLGG